MTEKKPLTLAVAKNAIPRKKDYTIRDTKTPGLGLRIYPTGVKSWIFQMKLGLKPVRLTLGPALSHPLETKFDPATGETFKGARQLAEEAAALIRQGLHPGLEKKKKQVQTQKEISKNKVTSKVAWEIFVEYKKSLQGKNKARERTLQDYERAALKLKESALWNRAISDITGDDLQDEINRQIKSATSKCASNGGMTQASITMRYFRAALNYTTLKKDLKIDSPFKKLNKLLPKWQTSNSRNRRLGETEGSLRTWWEAVDKLRYRESKDSIAIADWLQLSVFFGTRKSELLKLRWENVDLINNIITLPDYTTKGRREHVIPLTRLVREILIRREKENDERNYIKRDGTKVGKSIWVFQSSRRSPITKEMKHIVSPNKTIQQLISQTKLKFSPHDLRRTFATLLDEEGVSSITIENALNHSPATVAAKNYINNPRILKLRKIFQSLEDSILEEVGIKKMRIETVQISLADYELFLQAKKDGKI